MIGPARPSSNGTSAVAGPSRPPAAGPSLPAHLRRSTQPPSDDENDDDNYTPALPPAMAARTAQGPTLPPHLANRRRSSSPKADSNDGNASSSDEDSDDVGPAPMPAQAVGAATLSAAEEFRLREKRKQEEEDEKKRIAGLKPKREEWMMVPPSALDAMANVDPTKITKKGFNQSTRRGGNPADKATDEGRSLWTETPEERVRRLDDEVMGKRKRADNAPKQETDVEKAQRRLKEARNAEMKAQTDAYNTVASRNETLVTSHIKKTEREEADEKARKKAKSKHRKASRSPSPPPAAFWDREKMMGSAGRLMDEGKRKEIIGTSSENLNSKFGSGSYL